jgi:hypothetical protein
MGAVACGEVATVGDLDCGSGGAFSATSGTEDWVSG